MRNDPDDGPFPFEAPPVAAPLYPREPVVLPPERPAVSRRQASQKRQDLIARFVDDVKKLWEEQGESVLRRAAFHDPIKFAQLVASMVPKQVEHNVNPMEEIDDEQLDNLLNLAKAVAARNGGAASSAIGAREAAAAYAQSATTLQAVPEAD